MKQAITDPLAGLLPRMFSTSLTASPAESAAAAAPLADLQAQLARQLSAHRAVFDELPLLADRICATAQTLAATLAAGGRIFFFGNGGSACDSMHLAAEFTGRLQHERRPLAALALNADAAAMTAIANDYGYAEVFTRQLQALGRAGDCAVGISTSGRSPNVLQALRAARSAGLATVGLLGRGGGEAQGLVDHALVVAHEDSARIQEAHIFIGHTLCSQVEALLGLAPPEQAAGPAQPSP